MGRRHREAQRSLQGAIARRVERGVILLTRAFAILHPLSRNRGAAFDALLPPGLQHYWKANFVRKLTDDAIATHLEHGPQVPSMQSTVHIYPINGACHQVPADATAFGHRDASFATVIAGMWEDPADNKANIGWVRSYAKATAPPSEPGGYINFSSADDQPRVAENYGASFARLRQAKRRYDPGNLFRMNQNIAP